MKTFVDTNVFVRLFVTAEDDKQLNQVKRLFNRAQNGHVDLVTGPPVFFEVAWVLNRLYKVSNSNVLDILEAIISFPNLRVLDKELVVTSIFSARETNSAFADSYIAASAKGAIADNVATFNKKHFIRLGVDVYPLDE